MEMIVRRAERRLDLRTERRALQRAAVVPAPLMHGAGRTPTLHRSLEPEPAAAATRWG